MSSLHLSGGLTWCHIQIEMMEINILLCNSSKYRQTSNINLFIRCVEKNMKSAAFYATMFLFIVLQQQQEMATVRKSLQSMLF